MGFEEMDEHPRPEDCGMCARCLRPLPPMTIRATDDPETFIATIAVCKCLVVEWTGPNAPSVPIEKECLCKRDPVTGYRLDILCPRHDE